MSLDERLKSVAQAYLSMHEKKMDPVDKDELKGKHADRDDKDIDNDGDVDSSDEYLHKKRKAISKSQEEGKRGFVLAAKKAKAAGEKTFVFAGKTYNCEDVLNKEGVEIEVDKDSEASPEMKKKTAPVDKKKMKVTKKDDKDDKEKGESEVQSEGVDTSAAGDSPPAKAMAARDKEVLDQAKKDTKADKRRDEDKQDGTNAVKEAPKRHNDSKVGEKVMKKFKDMR